MPSWWTGLFGAGAGRSAGDRSGPIGDGVSLQAPAIAPTQSIVAAASMPLGNQHKFSVIGDEDRTKVQSITQKPWCAICHLKCEFPNGTFIGTGWLIDATTVITAGHNLWNPPADPDEPVRAVGKVKRITVTPAYLEGIASPFGSAATNHFVYDERWQTKPDPARRFHDYGAILLDKPGFKLPFYLQVWALPPEKWATSLRLNCAGYPVDLQRRFVTAAGCPCSETPGGSVFLGANQEMVIHNIDTEGGESGGPIFWTDATNYYALAVHTQGVGLAPGMNAGVRITPKMIEAFDRWRKDPDIQGPQSVE